MGPAEGAVDERFRDVDPAALVEVLGQRVQYPFDRPVPAPLLEVPVTSLVRRIAIGQIPPLRSGAQDPQHTVQDLAQILPRTAAAILAPPVLRKQRSDPLPLGVREIHDTSPTRGVGPGWRGSRQQALVA